jgi:hypothetical protein
LIIFIISSINSNEKITLNENDKSNKILNVKIIKNYIIAKRLESISYALFSPGILMTSFSIPFFTGIGNFERKCTNDLIAYNDSANEYNETARQDKMTDYSTDKMTLNILYSFSAINLTAGLLSLTGVLVFSQISVLLQESLSSEDYNALNDTNLKNNIEFTPLYKKIFNFGVLSLANGLIVSLSGIALLTYAFVLDQRFSIFNNNFPSTDMQLTKSAYHEVFGYNEYITSGIIFTAIGAGLDITSIILLAISSTLNKASVKSKVEITPLFSTSGSNSDIGVKIKL